MYHILPIGTSNLMQLYLAKMTTAVKQLPDFFSYPPDRMAIFLPARHQRLAALGLSLVTDRTESFEIYDRLSKKKNKKKTVGVQVIFL